jgi:hypothetical protein
MKNSRIILSCIAAGLLNSQVSAIAYPCPDFTNAEKTARASVIQATKTIKEKTVKSVINLKDSIANQLTAGAQKQAEIAAIAAEQSKKAANQAQTNLDKVQKAAQEVKGNFSQLAQSLAESKEAAAKSFETTQELKDHVIGLSIGAENRFENIDQQLKQLIRLQKTMLFAGLCIGVGVIGSTVYMLHK